MTNSTYRIYIRSNEHPRTINTPMMGRTNYSVIEVEGREAAIEKIKELRAKGENVYEVRYGFGGHEFNHWNIR
jgi:hypothetical protein